MLIVYEQGGKIEVVEGRESKIEAEGRVLKWREEKSRRRLIKGQDF